MGLRTFFWERIGAYPVRIRGERFVCHPRHAGPWRKFASGAWDPRTLDILESRLTPDSVVWDIGAHIGQIALYASRKCRRVVCFEPDPASLTALRWNVARNRANNIVVVGAAMAAKTGFIDMGSFQDNGKLGRGNMSLRPSPTAETIVVPALGPETWGEWLRAEPPNWVKMDIEGGEFELIPAMAGWLAENRPKLLLSLHAVAFGNMSAEESKRALEQCASALSFYGEYTELASGKKFPLSELATRMSGEAGGSPVWYDDAFLE